MRFRRTIPVLLLLALLAASAPGVDAAPPAAPAVPLAWQALGGPTGALTYLAFDPADATRLYAVASSSAYRSDEQQPVRGSAAGGRLRPSYALYRSRDAGATWQPLTNNLPAGPITAFYADPVTHALFAGVQAAGDAFTRRYGLWRSDDDGATWTQVPLGSDDCQVRRITRGADNYYLYLGLTRGVSAPDSYVYRSSDDGRTWEQFVVLHWDIPGDTLNDLHPDAREPAQLYVTTGERGRVYRSTDAGATWAEVRSDEPQPSGQVVTLALLGQSPDSPQPLFLVRGTDRVTGRITVERSGDGGVTWDRLAGTGLPGGTAVTGGAVVTKLAVLSAGVLLLGTDAGAFRSADGGQTWRLLEGPLSGGGIAALAVPPGSRTEVLAATGYGLYASRDAGGLWQPLGTSLPFGSNVAGLLTHPDQPKRVYAFGGAAGTVSGPPPVLTSADAGRTWSPAWRGLPAVTTQAWAISPADPQALYVLTSGPIYRGPVYSQFYRSGDGGLTWQAYTLDFSATALGFGGAARPAGGGLVLYVAGTGQTEGQPLARSDDGGATWRSVVADPQSPAQLWEPGVSVAGLAVDPDNPEHLWAGLSAGRVLASTDGGRSWQDTGLAASALQGLVADTASGLTLYAEAGGDVYRLAVRGPAAGGNPAAVPAAGSGSPASGVMPAASAAVTSTQAAPAQVSPGEAPAWARVSTGLPGRPILALLPDPRSPGVLWAATDGGGIYRSTDGGGSWTNAAAGLGDNLVQTLAIDYDTAGGILAGTVNAGIMALRPSRATAAAAPSSVDARIEILWPHDWQPVAGARLANIGVRLFQPGSLVPPACGWQPKVTIWSAVDTEPAAPLDQAKARTIDGQPFQYWELNDVDVRAANDPLHKMYFLVRVAGPAAATGVWAHGADPRTYFPQQDVPSGLATELVNDVDARIQIVWPHDEAGEARPVDQARLANVAVAFFKHGTRLSVPATWQPAGLALNGAWNQEIGRPISHEAVKEIRQSGAIVYPVWEFQNVPVARALDPANRLYLWVTVDGVETYPTIWAHGADTRTFFPASDEPVQGCVP